MSICTRQAKTPKQEITLSALKSVGLCLTNVLAVVPLLLESSGYRIPHQDIDGAECFQRFLNLSHDGVNMLTRKITTDASV